MSESDPAILAHLEATTNRIINLFPEGLSLVDVGACLLVVAIVFREQSKTNPVPTPIVVDELCELIDRVVAAITTVRPSVATQRH